MTELIDGDIIHMVADGELHRRWTNELTLWFARQLDPDRFRFLSGTTLPIGVGWAPSPDFYVYPFELED